MEFVVVNVAAVKPPLNAMVPVVLVKPTVPAPVLTAPENVVPPELVIVRLPLPLNVVPLIAAVPLFSVKLLLPAVTAPKVIIPLAELSVLLPVRVIAPNVCTVPVEETVPLILVLDGLLALPAVA